MDMKACDKMILAIIQDDSYQDVISELNESGFYATILHSSGGFLKKQSVTIMIGLNHEDLEKALKILKSHGKRTVMQQQVLFTAGYQLGGEQAGQQVQGYAVFNHAEELAV